MATDKTEVPNRTIIGISALVLGTLVAVQYSITSYFHSMYGAEQQRKVLGVESRLLAEAREADGRRLARIGDGMQQVASSLTSGVRPTAIAPQPSTDLQALQGWSLRPRVVPNPPPARGDLPAGADTTPSSARTANTPSTNAPGAGAPAAPSAPPVTAAAAAPTHAPGAAPRAH
jgi:hypothetical protein